MGRFVRQIYDRRRARARAARFDFADRASSPDPQGLLRSIDPSTIVARIRSSDQCPRLPIDVDCRRRPDDRVAFRGGTGLSGREALNQLAVVGLVALDSTLGNGSDATGGTGRRRRGRPPRKSTKQMAVTTAKVALPA